MATSSSSLSPLPLNTMVHMLTIKLTSSNYLLWRNQFIPLLTSQDLLGFLDGSVPAPSPKVTGFNGTTQMNSAYISWLTTDQTLLSLLYSSLTEESMGEILGLSHAHEALTTLEASFSHKSKTRELQLKDELQLMQRGLKSIAEFSRLFKGLYDQLTAIGRPIDNLDKVH
ncbi:Retrovirus-related Pol polyprotein from transposon RE1 [Vitis vinifera]|uniref:Retrovirus-related Pol polyprotein from transposon RE1 n=2 Tax=Vitis vinifera TaxID=29760 RepID=A0A438G7R3_VITVI|nr:Retrovirus-related Pol polyprotein from transposon RE1 [Vitis vinifera]